MTQLKNPVRRETKADYRGRNLIIQIEPLTSHPYCLVKVKEKGRRFWYTVSINQVFNLGAKNAAEAMRAEKKGKRRGNGI